MPIWWRRLYTDASLLAVIAQLLGGEEQEEGERREQVRLLDMTLIVSGAPGDGREDALFSLLSLCQTRLPSPSSSHSAEPLPKRPRLSPPSPSRHPAPHIINPIPRFSPADAPTLDAYLTQPTLLSRPFIISGGCLDWPATAPGLWDSREYLAQKAGGGRVVPVEVGTSYTEEGWGQRVVPFSSFLESIFTGEGEVGNKEKLYLAQHTLFHQFPSLLPDVLLPDYVYSSPPASADAPNYQPPNNEDGYTMNAWLGPKGTVSPPHTDRWFNCFGEFSRGRGLNRAEGGDRADVAFTLALPLFLRLLFPITPRPTLSLSVSNSISISPLAALSRRYSLARLAQTSKSPSGRLQMALGRSPLVRALDECLWT